MTDFVFFYGHTPGKYPSGCRHYVFSQWHPCSFVDNDGVAYTSAEQYMMAKKAAMFGDVDTLRKIMSTDDPRVIKAHGRNVRNFDDATWRAAAYSIVVRGNRLKFCQDPDLRDVLMGTGDNMLVEASPSDRVWGIGMTAAQARTTAPEQWKGTNLLGKALVQARDEIRSST